MNSIRVSWTSISISTLVISFILIILLQITYFSKIDAVAADTRDVLSDVVVTNQQTLKVVKANTQLQTASLHRVLTKTYFSFNNLDIADQWLVARKIRKYATAHDIDYHLVAAIIYVESNFDKSAVSPYQAQGLMQLKQIHFTDAADPFDISINIRTGTRFLSSLLKEYGEEGGIRRYYCGESNNTCINGTTSYAYFKKVMYNYAIMIRVSEEDT